MPDETNTEVQEAPETAPVETETPAPDAPIEEQSAPRTDGGSARDYKTQSTV